MVFLEPEGHQGQSGHVAGHELVAGLVGVDHLKLSVSHQHGVGVDHAPYLVVEKGKLGTGMIKSLCRQVDPNGMMNPGKLVSRNEEENE